MLRIRAHVVIYSRYSSSARKRPSVLDFTGSGDALKNLRADPALVQTAKSVFDKAGVWYGMETDSIVEIRARSEDFPKLFGVSVENVGGTWLESGSNAASFASRSDTTSSFAARVTLVPPVRPPAEPHPMMTRDLLLGEMGEALGSCPERVRDGRKVDDGGVQAKTRESMQRWKGELHKILPPPSDGHPKPVRLRIFEIDVFDQVETVLGDADSAGSLGLKPLASVSPTAEETRLNPRGWSAVPNYFQTFAAIRQGVREKQENWAGLELILSEKFIVPNDQDESESKALGALESEVTALVANLEEDGPTVAPTDPARTMWARLSGLKGSLSEAGRKQRGLVKTKATDFIHELDLQEASFFKAYEKQKEHAFMVATAASGVTAGRVDVGIEGTKEMWSSLAGEGERVVCSASFDFVSSEYKSIEDWGTSRAAEAMDERVLRVMSVGNIGNSADRNWVFKLLHEWAEQFSVMTVGGCVWTDGNRCEATEATQAGRIVADGFPDDATAVFPDVCATTRDAQSGGGGVLYPVPNWNGSELEFKVGSGSSLSTPQVAGAAALVWQVDSEATAQDVRRYLVESARPLDRGFFSEKPVRDGKGFSLAPLEDVTRVGVVNLRSAIKRAVDARADRWRSNIPHLSEVFPNVAPPDASEGQ